MIVSEEYKSFLWLPDKTGSNHAIQIFDKFGFKTMKKTDTGYELIKLKAVHNLNYPQGSENLLFICTARNPFTRLLSSYKFNNKNPAIWSPDSFRNFFIERFKLQSLEQFLFPFKGRVPDYFIRLENLVEDYGKIDFIRNSNFYQSGQLSALCTSKINSTPNILNPQDYFTDEMIETITTKGRYYFDLLKYSYPF